MSPNECIYCYNEIKSLDKVGIFLFHYRHQVFMCHWTCITTILKSRIDDIYPEPFNMEVE